MSRKRRYRELMEKAHQAHHDFSRIWNQTRDAELHKRKIDLDSSLWRSNFPWEQVWKVNSIAYQAASPQSNRRDEFLGQLFDEIPFEQFLAGQAEAIDAVLDFVEIETRAFRCGYAKQWCFRKLKAIRLNHRHKQRLSRLILELCKARGQGPELRELTRLMIKHADTPLVEALKALAAKSEDLYTRQKAGRVIQIILNSRHELKSIRE